MNLDKLLVIGRDRDSFRAVVGRKIREQRQDERQLAELRTTKHQLQARNSCVVDARSYRLARRLPVPTAARPQWKAVISVKRFGEIWRLAQEIWRLAILALADQPILRALFKWAQETVQSWQHVARTSTSRERSSQHYERTN